MSRETKPVAKKEETFDLLDIRLGRVITVEPVTAVGKPVYQLDIDFGKFGKKKSYGKFTKHEIDELKGQLVVGVLNFEPRQMGDYLSEVLVLGVQYPKADSGEATILTPLQSAKIGGKVF